MFIIIIIIFYTPGSKDPGLKNKKAEIEMSDGHRSGRSTITRSHGSVRVL